MCFAHIKRHSVAITRGVSNETLFNHKHHCKSVQSLERIPALATGDDVALSHTEAWGHMHCEVAMSLLIPARRCEHLKLTHPWSCPSLIICIMLKKKCIIIND